MAQESQKIADVQKVQSPKPVIVENVRPPSPVQNQPVPEEPVQPEPIAVEPAEEIPHENVIENLSKEIATEQIKGFTQPITIKIDNLCFQYHTNSQGFDFR